MFGTVLCVPGLLESYRGAIVLHASGVSKEGPGHNAMTQARPAVLDFGFMGLVGSRLSSLNPF